MNNKSVLGPLTLDGARFIFRFMGRGRKKLPGKKISVRLHLITLDRINFHAEAAKAKTGIEVTQEQCIQSLLDIALKQVGQ